MDELLKILGIPDQKTRIQVALEKDFSNLALTPEEAFLLSRVDACVSLHEIFQVSTFSPEATLRMLYRFAKEGWIRPQLPAAPTAGAAKRSVDPFLSAIDEKFGKLKAKNCTPYETLEISEKSTFPVAKKAFLKMTKTYHPDRLFRNHKGDYGEKLDFIFQALNGAIREIKAKKNAPAVQKAKQTKDLESATAERLRQAKALIRQGAEQAPLDPVGALNTLKLALSFDPLNEEAKMLMRDILPRANKKKAEKAFEEGVGLDDLLSYDEARLRFESACDLDPKNAMYQRKLGEFLLYKMKEGKSALSCAQKAVELEAKNVDNHMLLGFAYKALGAAGHAKACFEHVLKLDKGNLFAKNELALLTKNPNNFKH